MTHLACMQSHSSTSLKALQARSQSPLSLYAKLVYVKSWTASCPAACASAGVNDSLRLNVRAVLKRLCATWVTQQV